jgi:hypothetical protein
MKDKDFLEFLLCKEVPPSYLKRATALDIKLSFRSKEIVIKFLFFQFLGALFSMSVCPQFGLGLVEGHGLAHFFRMSGDWSCAAFCGALFLSSGMMVALAGMKGEEVWWVWNRHKKALIFLPAFAWSILMILNISLVLPGESLGFHLTWIIAAIFVEALWFRIRSHFVIRGLVGGRLF